MEWEESRITFSTSLWGNSRQNCHKVSLQGLDLHHWLCSQQKLTQFSLSSFFSCSTISSNFVFFFACLFSFFFFFKIPNPKLFCDYLANYNLFSFSENGEGSTIFAVNFFLQILLTWEQNYLVKYFSLVTCGKWNSKFRNFLNNSVFFSICCWNEFAHNLGKQKKSCLLFHTEFLIHFLCFIRVAIRVRLTISIKVSLKAAIGVLSILL